MTKIEPGMISPRLAQMMEYSGRGKLVETGFTLDTATYERSLRHIPERDHAIFHALCDKWGSHNKPHIWRRLRAKIFAFRYAELLMAALLLLLIRQELHCQPTQVLNVRGSNAGTTLFTRSAGLVNIDCEGSNTCTWTPATNTFTITAAGGGGTPAAPSGAIQFNNSGSFGGTSGFMIDPTTGVVTLAATAAPPVNLFAYSVSATQNSPLDAGDAGMAVIAQSLGAFLNGGDSISDLVALNGQSTVNNGTVIRNIANEFFANRNGGDVTGENTAIWAISQSFSFIGPISGRIVGVRITVGQDPDGAAGGTYGLLLEDNGGPIDPASNPVYAIYQQGATNQSVLEGSLAIDTGLTFQGHPCSLVANVMTCV